MNYNNGSGGPASMDEMQQQQQQQSPPSLHSGPMPADQALLVLIYDLLRRRGMDRSAELLAQEGELTTEQLGTCMAFVTQVVGGSGGGAGAKAGLLLQWWSMFWDVLAAKAQLGQAAGTNPMLYGMLQQMLATAGSTVPGAPMSPMMQLSPPPQFTEPPEMQRARLTMALGLAGLAGRDPALLNAAEKGALSQAMAQVMAMHKPQMAHIMQQQMMQQQMMYQQMLHQQQQQAKTKPILPSKPAPAPAPVQSPRPPTSPMLSPVAPAAPQAPPAEDPTHNFLLDSAQQPEPRTATEVAATRAAHMKRTRSLSQLSISSQESKRAGFEDEFISLPESLGPASVGFDLATVAHFREHEGKVAVVEVSADSLYVASGGQDRRIVIVEAGAGRVVGSLPPLHTERIACLRFAPYGRRRYLVSTSYDRTVQLWDLGGAGERLAAVPEKPVAVFQDHAAPVVAADLAQRLSAADEADTIATCDADGTLVVRSIKLNRVLHRTTNAAFASAKRICFEPDGDRLVALALEDRFEVYDWSLGRSVYTARSPLATAVVSLAWDRGLIVFATASEVVAWSVNFGLGGARDAETFTGHQAGVYNRLQGDKISTVAFLRPGTTPEDYTRQRQDRLIMFGTYQRIYMWRILYERGSARRRSTTDERCLVRFWETHESQVACVAAGGLANPSPFVASAGHDSQVFLWRLRREDAEQAVALAPASDAASGSPADPADPSAGLDFDPVAMFLNTDDL